MTNSAHYSRSAAWDLLTQWTQSESLPGGLCLRLPPVRLNLLSGLAAALITATDRKARTLLK